MSRVHSATTASGISSGDTASVGVGGLTLGGGIGWMVRAWGLAPTSSSAPRSSRRRGEWSRRGSSHPELLWALRGGGGNFGVVTRFDFRAHRLDGVVFAELAVSRVTHARCPRTLRDILRDRPAGADGDVHGRSRDGPERLPGGDRSARAGRARHRAARSALAPLLAPRLTE